MASIRSTAVMISHRQIPKLKINGFDQPNLLSSRDRSSKNKISPMDSKKKENLMSLNNERTPDAPLLVKVLVCIQCTILILFGYFRDFLRNTGLERDKLGGERPKMKDFVSLYSDLESLITRNIFIRVRDCANRPIISVPGSVMQIKDRTTDDYGWTFQCSGTTSTVINLGSYNYLGFAQNTGPCADQAAKAILRTGIGICSTRHEFGNNVLHRRLDRLVAEFLGVEDAITFPMGFATNSLNINCFVGKHCLILSDELNHASLILGSRLSGATIKVFKHNDMVDLEHQLRNAIIYGQRRINRAYRKILICVEGVYSMEGTIVDFPTVLLLKKKYKAYLYLDEAHSIGAIGPRGRGVCDYYGCDPREVDIMMGTFSKSFGAIGGYLAGKKKIIDYLRIKSHNANYGASMSPPVVQQIISSMNIIMGRDGTDEGRLKIQQLTRNSLYFRRRLKQMGFIVYGNDDSPVAPVLFYFMTNIAYASRELLKHGIAVVVVGYPATPITLARARFCLSASHTKDQLDKVLAAIDEIGSTVNVQYLRKLQNLNETIDY